MPTMHPDIELVRRGYEAFSKGDVETLSGMFANDIVQHSPGENPISGEHKGLQGVLTYYGMLAERTSGTLKVELESCFTDGSGHVVAVHHATGERNGKKLDGREALLFTIMGGKITDILECGEDDPYQWDSFWA